MKFGCEYNIQFRILSRKYSQYLRNFYCGNESIDEYLHYKAMDDRSGVTYLFIDEESNEIISFVTVSCSAVFSKKRPKGLSTITPAMEIQYFATDEKYQHLPYYKDRKDISLSDMIFDNIITELEFIARYQIGALLIVLYSVPQAVSFYQRHQFKPFGKTMYGDCGTFLDGCTPMFYTI